MNVGFSKELRLRVSGGGGGIHKCSDGVGKVLIYLKVKIFLRGKKETQTFCDKNLLFTSS